MTQESKYYGLTFNGHHSSEFGAYVVVGTAVEGFPAKTKQLLNLPGSSQVIDLSDLYGPVYGERTLTYTFLLLGDALKSRDAMWRAWTKVVNWLMAPSHKVILEDDLMPEYHYLAEVQDAPSLAEATNMGQLTISFQCYPFRIKNVAEFDDVWNTFNFGSDVAMNTRLEVGGRAFCTLINTGVADVAVNIEASSTCQVTINGATYSLDEGTNSQTEMVLNPGENRMTLSGDVGTTAVFQWNQEVI